MGSPGQKSVPLLLPGPSGHQPTLHCINHSAASGQNPQPPCPAVDAPHLGGFPTHQSLSLPHHPRATWSAPQPPTGCASWTGSPARLRTPAGGQGARDQGARDGVLDPDLSNSGTLATCPSSPGPQLPHLKRQRGPRLLRSPPALSLWHTPPPGSLGSWGEEGVPKAGAGPPQKPWDPALGRSHMSLPEKQTPTGCQGTCSCACAPTYWVRTCLQ